MGRISVFGDIEIFLNDTPRVGEEGPVSTDPLRYSFVSTILSVPIVTTAIGNLKLAMELNEPSALRHELAAGVF